MNKNENCITYLKKRGRRRKEAHIIGNFHSMHTFASIDKIEKESKEKTATSNI